MMGRICSKIPLMLPPSWSNCGYYWSHANLSLYIPATYTVWSGLAAISQMPGDGPNHRTLNPAVFHIANIVAHALAVLVVFNILRMFTAGSAGGDGCVDLCHSSDAGRGGGMGLRNERCPGRTVRIDRGLAVSRACFRRIGSVFVALFRGFRSVCCGDFVQTQRGDHSGRLRNHRGWNPARSLAACVLDMMPWLCVSAAVAVIAVLAQPTHYVSAEYPVWTRPLIAADALAFYLYKLVWPVGLCLDYGRSPPNVLNAGNGQAFWTWIIPLSVGVVLWWKRKQWPRGGDRGDWFHWRPFFRCWVWRDSTSRISRRLRTIIFISRCSARQIALAGFLKVCGKSFVVIALAASVMTVLAVMCHAQTFMWMSEPVAFGHVLDVNPRSEVGHSHLWQFAMNRRDFARAEAQARAIISLYPADSRGYMDLGDTLSETDRWQEAANAYQRAIQA